MKRLTLTVISIFLFISFTKAQITYAPFATGYNWLSDLASCNDERIFGVQKTGVVTIFDSAGVANPVKFLDITGRVNSTGLEKGLLSLTFAPDFKQSGVFYVYYSIVGQSDSRISRFRMSSDPNVADTTTEQVIITIPQPVGSHYGGDMAFGKDGYLYLGLGDGGGEGDPANHAQDTTLWLGKFLRLDVSDTSLAGYTIPGDNPFLQSPFPDEIWSVGFRNPWRWSFDKMTGDMWIGDVGQGVREEIDFQPAHSRGGENYGWRCYEGTQPYLTTDCQPNTSYVEPVSEYSHSNGCSVTGGFVYRGSSYHSMTGIYFYSDWCNATLRGVIKNGNTFSDTMVISTFTSGSVCFTEDQWGDLLVGTYNGDIVRLYDPTAHHAAWISDDDTLRFCVNDPAILHTPEGYGFHYQWNYNGSSTGTDTSAIVATQPGNYYVTVTNAFGLPQISPTTYVEFVNAPTVNISNLDTVYCSTDPGAGILVSPPGGELYIDGHRTMNYILDPAQLALGNHLIHYSYTNSTGCSGSYDQVVRIDACTFIDENFENGIAYYPVPSSEYLSIRSKGIFAFYDLLGNRLDLHTEVFTDHVEVDTKELAKGVYVCVIQSGNNRETFKWIKQ